MEDEQHLRVKKVVLPVVEEIDEDDEYKDKKSIQNNRISKCTILDIPYIPFELSGMIISVRPCSHPRDAVVAGKCF